MIVGNQRGPGPPISASSQLWYQRYLISIARSSQSYLSSISRLSHLYLSSISLLISVISQLVSPLSQFEFYLKYISVLSRLYIHISLFLLISRYRPITMNPAGSSYTRWKRAQQNPDLRKLKVSHPEVPWIRSSSLLFQTYNPQYLLIHNPSRLSP